MRKIPWKRKKYCEISSPSSQPRITWELWGFHLGNISEISWDILWEILGKYYEKYWENVVRNIGETLLEILGNYCEKYWGNIVRNIKKVLWEVFGKYCEKNWGNIVRNVGEILWEKVVLLPTPGLQGKLRWGLKRLIADTLSLRHIQSWNSMNIKLRLDLFLFFQFELQESHFLQWVVPGCVELGDLIGWLATVK